MIDAKGCVNATSIIGALASACCPAAVGSIVSILVKDGAPTAFITLGDSCSALLPCLPLPLLCFHIGIRVLASSNTAEGAPAGTPEGNAV